MANIEDLQIRIVELEDEVQCYKHLVEKYKAMYEEAQNQINTYKDRFKL